MRLILAATVAIIALITLLALARATFRCLLGRPRFGALSDGARLERLHGSPNWRDGEIVNLEPVPPPAESANRWELFRAGIIRPERTRPKDPLPSFKTDLATLGDERLVWFGHSSFLLTAGGYTILADPVLSRRASPIPLVNRAFGLEKEYSAADFPAIDCLVVSHDHWDHLDYSAIMGLKDKISSIVVPLGVGAHFERWGFSGFHEGDWGDSFEPQDGLFVHLVTARHFGGRGIVWRKVLWAGFVIEAGRRRIYYSGDSGYGSHFKAAGEKFGGFDLAILECGQYDRLWPHVHMTPEMTIQAAVDLRARAVMPAHCGRFAICRHPWDESLKRFSKALADVNIGLKRPIRAVTPVIGEAAAPFDESARYSRWWEGLK